MYFAATFFIKGFNPHTHTGCDVNLVTDISGYSVSIHTPIQGVTFLFQCTSEDDWVSIHTPIQGVTLCTCASTLYIRFQSTHPYRVWHKDDFCKLWAKMFQSTHPYRVWRCKSFEYLCNLCFNPHTHTGCDARQYSYRNCSHSFNPHTHTGCDV